MPAQPLSRPWLAAVVTASLLTMGLPAAAAVRGSDQPDDAGKQSPGRAAKPEAEPKMLPQPAQVPGFGPTMPIKTWPVPSPDAGLSSANQGPQYGEGGILSWRGALWFLEEDAYKIGRIDTRGNITEYPLPGSLGEAPYGAETMAVARSDELWLSVPGLALQGGIGVMTDPGVIQRVRDLGYIGVTAIAADPDGGVWTIYDDGEGISRFRRPTSEDYFEHLRYRQGKVTMGPGGVWIGDAPSVVKRMNRTTGSTASFPIPSDGGHVFSAMTNSGGRVWYSKFRTGTIFTPASEGVIGSLSRTGRVKVHKPPVADLIPTGLTPAPNGGVFFVTRFGTGIGHLSRSGSYRLVSMPDGFQAESITVGPDGNLWFVDHDLNRVGRIRMKDFNAFTGVGRLAVGRKAVPVRRNRMVLPIACPRSAVRACAGKVRVTIKGGRALTRTTSYRVSRGSTRKVRVRLTAAGRRALPKGKAVRVVGRLSPRGSNRVAVRKAFKVVRR